MGNLGTDADGFPSLFTQLQALSNSFGVELAADQAIGPIATLGGVPGILDPTPLDTTIGNYVAAMPVGESIVADVSVADPPDLPELPIASSFGVGLSGPPSQLTQDFGTVKVGSPAQMFTIGETQVTNRGLVGMKTAQQISGDRSIFNVVTDDQTDPFTGLGYIDHNMVMTPVTVGVFTAQVNTVGGTANGFAIWTFTVNVTP